MAVLVFFTLELSEADVLTCRMIYNTASVLVFLFIDSDTVQVQVSYKIKKCGKFYTLLFTSQNLF